jgi:hypothetical protein
MVRTWHLDPAEPYFRNLILRHGGPDAINRILHYLDEP